MMLLWAFAGIPLGVYTIAQNLNVALQVQPQLLTFLSLITWGQCLYYKKVIQIRLALRCPDDQLNWSKGMVIL